MRGRAGAWDYPLTCTTANQMGKPNQTTLLSPHPSLTAWSVPTPTLTPAYLPLTSQAIASDGAGVLDTMGPRTH